MIKNESIYVAPKVKPLEIDAQGIICQSGNESMREVDLGDGGFTEG